MRAKLRAEITETVQKAVSAYIQKNEVIPPEGFNTLAAIRGALFHWLYVPFGSAYALMQLRCPTAGDMPDNIRVLEVFSKKKTSYKDYKHDEIVEYLNMQERFARAVMNNPTFAEYEEMINQSDNVRKRRKHELAVLEKRIENNPALKREFEFEIRSLQLQYYSILPQNTMAF